MLEEAEEMIFALPMFPHLFCNSLCFCAEALYPHRQAVVMRLCFVLRWHSCCAIYKSKSSPLWRIAAEQQERRSCHVCPCSVAVGTCRKQESDKFIWRSRWCIPSSCCHFGSENPKHCPQRDQPAWLLYFHFLQQTLCTLSLVPDVLDWFEYDNELAGRFHIFLTGFLVCFICFLILLFVSVCVSFHVERRKDVVITSETPALWLVSNQSQWVAEYCSLLAVTFATCVNVKDTSHF